MKKHLLATAILLASLTAAIAQSYPSRPITIVVPFPAGGPTDAIVRNLGERMRVSLGQPVVVEYVSGAGGTIGVGRVARATPDGYTLILGHNGTHVMNGAVYTLPYDLVKDFAPISLLPINPYVIDARKTLPANDLRAFMAYLKANPGTVTAAIPGVGTGPHLLAIQLQNMAGGGMQYVPYRGNGPSMIDLVAGQIDVMVDQVQNSAAHIRAGSIKAFAVASPERASILPDVPTVDEAGAPGLYMSVWYGLWAPAGTPKDVIGKLNAAVVEALADPGIRARLTDLGMQIPPREQQTPHGLAARQKADIETWWPVIKAANIKVE